ncbi:Polyubiquitin-like protein [Drosera capensis]
MWIQHNASYVEVVGGKMTLRIIVFDAGNNCSRLDVTLRDGKSYHLKVENFYPIGDYKKLFKYMLGRPPVPHQAVWILLHDEKVMDDDEKTLLDYDVKHVTVMRAVFSKQDDLNQKLIYNFDVIVHKIDNLDDSNKINGLLTLDVIVRHGGSKNCLDLEVLPGFGPRFCRVMHNWYPVRKFKNELWGDTRRPFSVFVLDYRVADDFRELDDDDKALIDYDIKPGSVMHIEFPKYQDLCDYDIVTRSTIYVISTSMLAVSRSMAALDMSGVQPFTTRGLNKTLIEYGIWSRARIHAFVPVHIIVKYSQEDEILLVLNVLGSDTIDYVKAKLFEKVAIPPERQSLCFHGKFLTNGNRSLADYNVKEHKSIFYVHVQNGNLIMLSVRTLVAEQPYTLNVYDSVTIRELRSHIKDVIGHCPRWIILGKC